MKYISSNPEIMGGDPVIAGTRVPIERILFLLRHGNTIQEIHEMYDWVSLAKLKGAIEETAEYIATTLHAKKAL